MNMFIYIIISTMESALPVSTNDIHHFVYVLNHSSICCEIRALKTFDKIFFNNMMCIIIHILKTIFLQNEFEYYIFILWIEYWYPKYLQVI